jgi:hypothetical protein
MSYNVIRLSTTNPTGEVVANYPTKEQADATREVLNNTTPASLLYFFIVLPS